MKSEFTLFKGIVSILIAVSIVFTPVFTQNAAADMSEYEEHVIYSGLPESKTEETVPGGVRFAVYPLNDNLISVNSGTTIKTSYKAGVSASNSEILESIFTGYPVTPSTHKGIVSYLWQVRFGKALPSKIMVQSRDSENGWGLIGPVYKGFFGIDTIYTIALEYNTITGGYKLLLNGEQMEARDGYPHCGTISTDILAPQLQFTFKDVSASVDILGAKLTYSERSTKVIYEGIPGSGISDKQNGATFIASPNNYGITAVNTGSTIDAYPSENYKSGDYIQFMTIYPVKEKTHSGTVTYEYTASFSGTPPGTLNVESRHTKNDWAFAQPITASVFGTDTDYTFTLTYDISSGKYTIKVKKKMSGDVILSYEGTSAGGVQAGLQAPYLQWKPRSSESKIHFKGAKVIYTGHEYTLQNATLSKSGEGMAANINLYKARGHNAADDNVRIMIAGYGEGDRMTSFTCKKVSLADGENELQLILNQPIENTARSRIFIWEDGGITPLTGAGFFSDGSEGDMQSIMNMDYMIENIYLKDCTVLMTEADYIYSDGKKQNYPQGCNKPIEKNGTFMIPSDLLGSMCGINVSFNESTGVIKVGNKAELSLGSSVMKLSSSSYSLPEAPVLLNDTPYLPFEALMEKGLSKDAYCDERGMLIFTDNTFSYTDSEYFLKVFDTVDHIYRYMQYDNPSGAKMLSEAESTSCSHPRLILTAEQQSYVLSKIASGDARWTKAANSALSNANAVISSGRVVSANPSDSEKQGEAAQYAADMKHLSSGFLLTNDEKYAAYAMKNLENAIKWDNLGENTAQLTMGDWAYAIALSLDVFYDYMKASAEGIKLYEDVKTAVKLLLYTNLIAQYKGTGTNCRWVRMTDNFTGVCGGGVMMLLCALSGEEDMQNETGYLLENVYKSLQIPLGIFAPDGGWYEGVSYGNYCLTNMADAFVAMKNTFGTIYGLDKGQGFKEIPDFYLSLSTPGQSFNFHDMPPRHENALKSFSVAYLTGDVTRLEALKRHRQLSGEEFDIQSLMFYDMLITDKGLTINTDTLSRDRYFKNAGAGGFLSSITEKNPTFVGFHGGYTGMVHDSLDLGEFVFEADGVMWACDLGSDYYSLPTYFVIPDGYRHYRKNPQGENCVVINPLTDSSYYGQKVGAEAPLVKFETADNGAMAAFDLTEGYERDVSSYKRGYLFGDNRKTLTVRDEITLKQNSELYWFMHTPASIQILDNKTALLSYGGKQCKIEVLCSDASYELCKMDANLLTGSPGKGEEHLGKSNSHVKKLAVHFTSAKKGNLNITVKLIPQSGNFELSGIDGVTPINEWTIN